MTRSVHVDFEFLAEFDELWIEGEAVLSMKGFDARAYFRGLVKVLCRWMIPVG